MKKSLGLFLLCFALIFSGIPFLAVAGTEVTTFEEPDVHRAFCGKQIPYAFCLCAFQNQGCEIMNLTQEEGRSTVEGGFRDWVGTQINEVAKSCIDGGGHWNTATRQCITCTDGDVRFENKCVPPEEAVGETGNFCASLKAFADDWRSFSDFAGSVSETDTSDAVREYYQTSDTLRSLLSSRHAALYDQTLTTVVLSHVDAYTDALAGADEIAVAQTLSTLVWYGSIVPETQRRIIQNLLTTEDESLQGVYSSLAESVPDEALLSGFKRSDMEEGLKDLLWETAYPQILGYGDGIGVANTSLTEQPDSYLVATDAEIVSQLQQEHEVSLMLDRTKAELLALRAQQRVVALQGEAMVSQTYNEMESYKKQEYERAQGVIELSCNQ